MSSVSLGGFRDNYFPISPIFWLIVWIYNTTKEEQHCSTKPYGSNCSLKMEAFTAFVSCTISWLYGKTVWM